MTNFAVEPIKLQLDFSDLEASVTTVDDLVTAIEEATTALENLTTALNYQAGASTFFDILSTAISALSLACDLEDSEIAPKLFGGLTHVVKEFANQKLFKKWKTRIPYDKITTLIYVRIPYHNIIGGYLLFRWEGNKTAPIRLDNLFSFAGDQTAISTDEKSDTLFYHLYNMLKVLAPETTDCRELSHNEKIEGVETLARKVDMDTYFSKYAPFREQAVAELIKRTGADKYAALALVDREFDIRQKAMYAANPIAAIQDLNRFLGRKTQLEEEARKALEARRERYRQEETLRRLEQLEREARQNR